MGSKIPPRKTDSHKGENGVVCIVGGSRTFHGAPFLSAMGAARAGVDLVYVAVPAIIAGPIRSLSPDLIVLPLPDSKLTRGNASRLTRWLPNLGSIGIGPRVGAQNPNELKNAVMMLSTKCRTLVADADALRSVILDVSKDQREKMIVTPHAGEFERVFGMEVPANLDERMNLVMGAAREHGLVVLLKGSTDVISDGHDVALNKVHTPAMTTGGTGDVLTGVTSGLAAIGLNRFDAACCAAYINGLAGVEAVEELGLHIVASDVISRIPKAMKRFDRIE